MHRAGRALALFAVLAVVFLRPATQLSAQEGWEAVGPGGGFVWALAVSPAFESDGTVFVGTDGGGVFRSTDEGSTWQEANSGLTTNVVPVLGVSPAFATDSTIFAAGPEGVFRSVDGGDTWTQVNKGLSNKKVLALAVSPAYAKDSTVFAGTTNGVFRSADGGGIWEGVSSGLTGANVLSIGVSPAFESDSTLYTGLLPKRVMRSFGGGKFETPDGGVFRSTDRGDSWQAIEELHNLPVAAFGLSAAVASDFTVFAGTFEDGILRSTDRRRFLEARQRRFQLQTCHGGRAVTGIRYRLHGVRRLIRRFVPI